MGRVTKNRMVLKNSEVARIGATGKLQRFYDAQISDLFLLVTPKGHKSLWVKKGEWKMRVTEWNPLTDLAQVRQDAAKYIYEYQQGNDPKKKKDDYKECKTFLNAYEDWKDRAFARGKRTIYQTDYFMEKYLGGIKNEKLVDITVEDIEKIVHGLVGQKKPRYSQANKQLEFVRRIYNFAKKKYRIELDCPANHIDNFPCGPSLRFMNGPEFEKFIDTVNKEPNAETRHCLQILCFTLVRVNNAVKGRFSEIDWDRKLWIIPGLKSKNGQQMTIPLNDRALQTLKERRELVSGDFFFPDRATTTCHRFSWVNRIVEKTCKRAGIPTFSTHALRKSGGAYLINVLKIPLFIVSKLLSHSSIRVTEKSYSMVFDNTLLDYSNMMSKKIAENAA